MPESTNVKVAENAVKIEDHERRITDVEKKTNSLERLTTLVELNMKQTEKISETLEGINKNLSSLNHDVGFLKDGLTKMDGRVSSIENEKNQDLSEFKEKSWNFYLKIAGGLILLGLAVWLGLK